MCSRCAFSQVLSVSYRHFSDNSFQYEERLREVGEHDLLNSNPALGLSTNRAMTLYFCSRMVNVSNGLLLFLSLEIIDLLSVGAWGIMVLRSTC